MPNLAAAPPPLLASLAVSAGVVVLFFANLLIALGQPAGTPGNVRLLQFLAPADLAVAAILVLAVALAALGPRPAASEAPVRAGPTAPELAPATARMAAGAVAGFVAVAALVRAITVLTIGHQHGAVKLGNMFDALATVLVAAIGALWALRSR